MLSILCLFLFWSPSIADDNIFLLKRGSNHVLRKFKVRRGCTVPSPLTWPSTKKSDGTEKLATTDSEDGFSVLPETKFVWTRLRVDTTRVLSAGVPFPYGNCRIEVRVWLQTVCRGSTPDFCSGLSPEVYSTRGYFRKISGVFMGG